MRRMSFETLLVEPLCEHIVLLTLNRPHSRNAINHSMAEDLRACFRTLNPPGKADLRAIILTGSGNVAFCAGADLRERQEMDRESWAARHVLLEEAFAAIRGCAVPVIAALNGHALGGGCELALACDLVVASEQATLGQPEVQRGIIPGCGATWTLPRRIGLLRAKELILTGKAIPAQEALRWGMVNRVVPPGEVLPAARELAEQIAANSPLAVREAKGAIDRGLGLSLEAGVASELEAYRRVLASKDPWEGVRAFAEGRPPRFE